jgi:hypothetical protein
MYPREREQDLFTSGSKIHLDNGEVFVVSAEFDPNMRDRVRTLLNAEQILVALIANETSEASVELPVATFEPSTTPGPIVNSPSLTPSAASAADFAPSTDEMKATFAANNEQFGLAA